MQHIDTNRTQFSLSTEDVELLAGRVVPICFLSMIVWVGSARFFGSPLLDADNVVPSPPNFKIDLNSAAWPELAQLPRVGIKLADRIVTRRNEHGPFASVDELTEVHGIGEKTLVTIRGYCLSIDTAVDKAKSVVPTELPPSTTFTHSK